MRVLINYIDLSDEDDMIVSEIKKQVEDSKALIQAAGQDQVDNLKNLLGKLIRPDNRQNAQQQTDQQSLEERRRAAEERRRQQQQQQQ